MADLSGVEIGRYHIIEQLGEGGMAIVYKAYDTRLEREVAVKLIRKATFPPEILDEVLKRFEREAKSLARLSHPNIVKVHDFGEYEGSPYLVLEYLPGGTLKKLLGKPIPWQEALRLILPVARGVDYAHQHGIIHRDIKPANILITETGEPMLSDFGIAKILERGQATALTGSGMAVGTPEYMAPEQWNGQTSALTDLYSLGIVLYEMVAGRKPYLADTPAAVLIKQATEPLPSPKQFEPLPDEVEFLLIKALAKDPADRFANMGEFVRAMEGLLGLPTSTAIAINPEPQPDTNPTPPSSPILQARRLGPTPPPLKVSAPPTPPPPAAPRQRKWLMPVVLVGGVVVLCLIAACLVFSFGPTLMAQFNPPPALTATPLPATQTKPAPPKPTNTSAPKPTATAKSTATAAPLVATLAPAEPFFKEDFSHGLEDWEPFFLGTGDAGKATIQVHDSRLTFDLEGKQIYAYYFYKPQTYTDVKLTLKAANLGINANNIGLVCHRSQNGWYEFSVSNGGYWYLYYQSDGGYEILADGGSTAMKLGKATNLYEMSCQGNLITLRINGVKLTSIQETRYALKKGQIGLTVSSIDMVPVVTEIEWLDIEKP